MAAQRSNFALKHFRIVVNSWYSAITRCQMDDTLHCYLQSILRIQTVVYTGFYENWHPSLHIVWMFSSFSLVSHLAKIFQKRISVIAMMASDVHSYCYRCKEFRAQHVPCSRIGEAVILESENAIAKWSENTIHHFRIRVINFEKP